MEDGGYTEIREAVKRAKEEGVFVVSTSLESEYGFPFSGLGREPLSDPNGTAGYAIGNWQLIHLQTWKTRLTTDLFFPMDSRTYASWTGENDYAWGRAGGWSWVVPYIAGLYALCAQVYPDITPEIFWKNAFDTSVPLTFDFLGKKYLIRNIANPTGLMEKIKNLD